MGKELGESLPRGKEHAHVSYGVEQSGALRVPTSFGEAHLASEDAQHHGERQTCETRDLPVSCAALVQVQHEAVPARPGSSVTKTRGRHDARPSRARVASSVRGPSIRCHKLPATEAEAFRVRDAHPGR